MKNYLSFGAGVNSVALYLLMESMGIEFEAVFVDHGADWPETYEYVEYFIATGRPLTVLSPDVGTVEKRRFSKLMDYLEFRNILPSRAKRWCTDRFKVQVFNRYMETPCFVFIGFAADEVGRATMSSTKGAEYRWPLIEHDITRQGCIDMIKAAGLVVPRKSGCYVCPFQGAKEYRELRKSHPDLFCRVRRLEESQNSRITKTGTQWKPYYLAGKPLADVVSLGRENQLALPGMESMEYPPCQCGL